MLPARYDVAGPARKTSSRAFKTCGMMPSIRSSSVNGDSTYDFNAAILFWIGSSVVSLLLAASLWRTRLRD